MAAEGLSTPRELPGSPCAARWRESDCITSATPSAPPHETTLSCTVKLIQKGRCKSTAKFDHAAAPWLLPVVKERVELEGEEAAPSFVHAVKSCGISCDRPVQRIHARSKR